MKVASFSFIQLLFPSFCISCQKFTSSKSGFYRYLCPQCLAKIKILDEDHCIGCYSYTPLGKTCSLCQKAFSLKGVLVASEYENPILKEVIHAFKYRNVKDLSLPLAWILFQKLKDFSWGKKGNWILVPVPLAKRRLRNRGFNQAELLAQNLGKILNISVFTDIIKRVKFCQPQADIKNKQERQANIKGAFGPTKKINQLDLKQKKIMLIDDVLTTGATLNECARVLKPYVKEVWGCVVAR